MVVLEQGKDGRWWLSENGWGRPVGTSLEVAKAAVEEYYPGKTPCIITQDMLE